MLKALPYVYKITHKETGQFYIGSIVAKNAHHHSIDIGVVYFTSSQFVKELGKKQTEETKQKISAANKGNIVSQETRMSISNKNRPKRPYKECPYCLRMIGSNGFNRWYGNNCSMKGFLNA